MASQLIRTTLRNSGAVNSLFSAHLVSTSGGPGLPTPSAYPQRPPTAFALYVKTEYPKRRATNRSIMMTDIAKLLGREWKTMSPSEKTPITDRAREMMKEYKQKVEELPKETKAEMEKEKRKRASKLNTRRLKGEKKKLSETYDRPSEPLGSGYQLYMREKLRGVRIKSLTEGRAAVRKYAAEWRNMTAEERSIYTTRLSDMKEQYGRDLSQWESKMRADGNEKALEKLVKLESKVVKKVAKKTRKRGVRRVKKVAKPAKKARAAKKEDAAEGG